MLRSFVVIAFTFFFIPALSQNKDKLRKERDSLWSIVQNRTIETNSKTKFFTLLNDVYNKSLQLKDDDFQLKVLLKELAYRINTQTLDGFEPKLVACTKIANKIGDDVSLAKVYSYKSWYFSQLGYFDRAKEALKNSEKFAKKINDSDVKYGRLHTIYLAHSIIAENKNLPADSVVFYVKKAYEYALKRYADIPDKNLQVANAAIILASPEYNNNLNDAVNYLKVAENALSKTGDKAMFTQIYKAYARIEREKGNFKKSIEYCEKGLQSAKDFEQYNEIVELSMLMSDNFKSLKDYKNATLYADKYIKLSDSLNGIQKNVQVDSKLTKFSNDNVNTISGFINKYSFLLFSLLSLLLFFAVLRLSKLRKDSLKKEIQNNTHFENSSIDKNSLNDDQDLVKLVSLAKTDEHSFYLKFAEIYPDFNNCVKDIGNLNPSEIKLCNYLKLNFDTKQIAQYTNSSPKAIESKKYRLRKKFDLQAHEDLYAFISKISTT